MSTTIGNLVDRIYREYLEPNDDIQSFTVLTGGLTASSSDQTVAYNADFLTTEEEDSLGTGAFIEINQELMLVTSLNTAASTMAVKRAARGTTLAAHSTNDEIKVNPPFPRKVVLML